MLIVTCRTDSAEKISCGLASDPYDTRHPHFFRDYESLSRSFVDLVQSQLGYAFRRCFPLLGPGPLPAGENLRCARWPNELGHR